MIMVRCPKEDCQELMRQGAKDCGKKHEVGKVCTDCGKPHSDKGKRCSACALVEHRATTRRSRAKMKAERDELKAAVKKKPAELSTDHLNQAMLAQRMLRGAIVASL